MYVIIYMYIGIVSVTMNERRLFGFADQSDLIYVPFQT